MAEVGRLVEIIGDGRSSANRKIKKANLEVLRRLGINCSKERTLGESMQRQYHVPLYAFWSLNWDRRYHLERKDELVENIMSMYDGLSLQTSITVHTTENIL